jgi:hypothetical protein
MQRAEEVNNVAQHDQGRWTNECKDQSVAIRGQPADVVAAIAASSSTITQVACKIRTR